MSDFETQLKQRLNDSVDARLGSAKTPPPLDVRREQQPARRPRRWYPLLAACLVLIVGGTVAALRLTNPRSARPVSPATQPATIGVTTPATTPTTSMTAPRAESSAPRSSQTARGGAAPPAQHRAQTSASTATNRTSLGSASISLPAGWVAHRRASDASVMGMPTWCLAPAGMAVNPQHRGCPVLFAPLDPSMGIDANIEGGYLADPHYCRPGPTGGPLSFHEQSAERTFGGRAADWRRWEIECPVDGSWQIEQYVVSTGPGYLLFSERADHAVQAAMAEIAANSQLPSRAAPIRLWDEGYLRTVDRTAHGVRITLDRIAMKDNKVVSNNPRTYEYLVPTAVFDEPRGELSVGTLIYLGSDGHTITKVLPHLPHAGTD